MGTRDKAGVLGLAALVTALVVGGLLYLREGPELRRTLDDMQVPCLRSVPVRPPSPAVEVKDGPDGGEARPLGPAQAPETAASGESEAGREGESEWHRVFEKKGGLTPTWREDPPQR